MIVDVRDSAAATVVVVVMRRAARRSDPTRFNSSRTFASAASAT